MSAQILSFNQTMPALAQQELADDSLSIDPKKLSIARKRLQVVQGIQEVMKVGWSLNKAAEHLVLIARRPSSPFNQLCKELGKSGRLVGKAQMVRWVKAYNKDGAKGLIDQRKGRKKMNEGWELRAMRLYARPQKPSYQLVTDQLNEEGFEVTYSKVRNYLKSLPTNMTDYSNGRLGAHYNALNTRKYHIRSTEELPVGFIYQGDGHTVDVYVAHPATGDIFRPELTAWIDVRSRYITGWWLGEAENSTDTLFALSHAMCGHNHVPAMLHVDHGAGYRSKLMNDEHTGVYKRFNIEPIFAIPGNAKGKGHIERWFRTMEIKFGKRFDTYCGKDMAGDALRQIVKGVKAGTYTLPSLKEYAERLATWIDVYNNTPHSGLDGKTPAEVWKDLEQVRLDMPMDAVILPVKERTVRRTGVTLDKRIYRNDELLKYEGAKVFVQYSVHTDKAVRILTQDNRWICDAMLAEKTAYLPDSRLEENKIKRLEGQQKRLQIKMDENERRAMMQLGAEPDLSHLEYLEAKTEDQPDSTGATALTEPDDEPVIMKEVVLDVTDISCYEHNDDL